MTWPEVLDAFEARIVEQRAALDRGDLDPMAPFVAPLGMPPLGGPDLDRARALLDDVADLTAELEGELAHVRDDLTVVRTLVSSTASAPVARFVDTAL